MSDLVDLLAGFGATADPAARWDAGYIIARERLAEAITALRDDPRTRCQQLLDLAGVDYLQHPSWTGPRFAVVYILKDAVSRVRIRLKVLVEEDDAVLPTLCHVFPIADWLEREVFDQYGIRFQGHPNLRRLLNHHEFVGHPLRKDYPCQKRQKLSTSDPMIDQLCQRLGECGYQVVEVEPADGAEVPGGRP